MKTNTESEPRLHVRSKAEEIAILRDAIAKLGPLSYCGPWLACQLAEIERDLGNDFFPQVDRAAAIRDCEQLIAVAKDNAREIEATAHRIAKAKTDAAHAEAVAIRGRLLSEIRKCQTTLGVQF